ncbi:GntR family transcriptional regulator [Streptomyces sp. WAC04189]|uniref:winged helix-turn-helix domain-containing protein n=2 Tax=Streptomyces TaxID=1883 RepID=UPI000FA83BB6|nr:winged helix-turn-helix domain-containing protein [Streptomyces sp. WAC04189]RSR99561.1 GntR family transcriptional regulator [Streptomyces sp. WAC04189]
MIDRTQPVHPQIATIMRQRIADGTYPAGSRVPGVVALSAEFDVAVSTVHRAMAALREEGLIITWSGRGSFVAE